MSQTPTREIIEPWLGFQVEVPDSWQHAPAGERSIARLAAILEAVALASSVDAALAYFHGLHALAVPEQRQSPEAHWQLASTMAKEWVRKGASVDSPLVARLVGRLPDQPNA